MNINKLKEAEAIFFQTYPDGFQDESLAKGLKKHKMGPSIEFSHDHFAQDKFDNLEDPQQLDQLLEHAIKLVSKSSMVSLFEKPKFRDALRSFDQREQTDFAQGLYELLHKDEEKGFNILIDVLLPYKLAKWTLISVFRCYYYPETDFLFKPTTVKNILKALEIEDIKYSPKPSYEFFVKYRNYINSMKVLVDPRLSPNNAAFSGFLMMVVDQLEESL